jgi:hypothetical protein
MRERTTAAPTRPARINSRLLPPESAGDAAQLKDESLAGEAGLVAGPVPDPLPVEPLLLAKPLLAPTTPLLLPNPPLLATPPHGQTGGLGHAGALIDLVTW